MYLTLGLCEVALALEETAELYVVKRGAGEAAGSYAVFQVALCVLKSCR